MKKTTLLGVVFVLQFAAVAWLGIEYGKKISPTQLPKPSLFAFDDNHQLLTESGSWYALREMLPANVRLHSLALAKSRACPECVGTWERWGSQDYYSVPVVAQFSNDAGIYEVVVGTAFHMKDYATTYDPRFVIYYATKGGNEPELPDRLRQNLKVAAGY